LTRKSEQPTIELSEHGCHPEDKQDAIRLPVVTSCTGEKAIENPNGLKNGDFVCGSQQLAQRDEQPAGQPALDDGLLLEQRWG